MGRAYRDAEAVKAVPRVPWWIDEALRDVPWAEREGFGRVCTTGFNLLFMALVTYFVPYLLEISSRYRRNDADPSHGPYGLEDYIGPEGMQSLYGTIQLFALMLAVTGALSVVIPPLLHGLLRHIARPRRQKAADWVSREWERCTGLPADNKASRDEVLLRLEEHAREDQTAEAVYYRFAELEQHFPDSEKAMAVFFR